MNSMPASSAIRARARQSSQFPDQRSGTRVTARPDEQLAPNRPSFSRFRLYIVARSVLPPDRSIDILARLPRHLQGLQLDIPKIPCLLKGYNEFNHIRVCHNDLELQPIFFNQELGAIR